VSSIGPPQLPPKAKLSRNDCFHCSYETWMMGDMRNDFTRFEYAAAGSSVERKKTGEYRK
jgi:hypothetical protein